MERPRQKSLSTPREMIARGHFGQVRTKRKLLRETPPRNRRRNGSDASSSDSQGLGDHSLKSINPGHQTTLNQGHSLPHLVLQHFQMDSSMLDEDSSDAPQIFVQNRVEEKKKEEVEEFPPPKDFIQELIQKYSINHQRDFGDLANRAKSIQPVDVFWEKRTGLGYMPSARTGGTLSLINRKLYLFGGECRTKFNDIKILNPITWKWEAPSPSVGGDPPPEPRVGHSAVTFKNSLIIFGGAGNFNPMLKIRSCFNRVHIYDTISNEWKTAEPYGISPSVRRNHACALVGNTMLVYGGMDELGNVLDDLHALNLETMRWSTPRIHKSSTVRPGKRHSLSLIPAFQQTVLRQYHFDMFHIPNAYDEVFTRTVSGLYLFGGADSAGKASKDLFLLKPKAIDYKDDDYYMKWTQPLVGGTPPEPRYAYSAALRGKYIAFFGGRDDSLGRGGIIVSSLALLNLESMRWETVLTYGIQPAGRWGAAVASFGSQLIIFGGLRLEEYCSGKLVLLETDPQTVQEKKTEFAYLKEMQKAAGAKAFDRLSQASVVVANGQNRIRELRNLGKVLVSPAANLA